MGANAEPALTPAADAGRRAMARFAPGDKLTCSQYADSKLVVTVGPMAGTRWQTSTAEFQRGMLDAFHEPGVTHAVIMGSSQWGKALAIDTPLPTPDGWTTMGSVRVGDWLFDERGQPCRVTFVTDIMADHRCFNLRFCDGAEIVADAEHRWKVESAQWADRPRGSNTKRPASRILTTEEIARTYRTATGSRYAIPLTEALDLPDRFLPIDPYVLGVWLGDGHTKSPKLTIHETDLEILDNLRSAGAKVEVIGRTETGTLSIRIGERRRRPPCPTCGRGLPLRRLDEDEFWKVIVGLGLNRAKAIPAEYLRASEVQRWALLQGLMDTDGFVDRKGSHCEFVTTSETLAAGMVDLLASLGLKYSISHKEPSCLYRGQRSIGQRATRFKFTAYREAPIFRLSRKQRRLVPADGSIRPTRPSESKRRRIIEVREVASVPVKCISVDSESRLFLAGQRMVPTHNTSIAVAQAAYHIEHDPCPILIVEPTVEPMAKDFAKNRLDVLIREVPSLAACVTRKRQAGGSNTTLQKTFKGGSLSIAGAESPASLAARSIRYLVLDEVDRYPAEVGEEGSPISLAMKRTTAYRRKKRILMLGSPTLVEGPINQWYEMGDRRRFHVPCPECGDMHPYRWADVVWRDNDPATARLKCPACGYEVDDVERVDALAGGRWIAENPDRDDKAIVSFHVWEAYSPFSSLRDIVAEFLRVRKLQKAGSRAEMRAWQNTTLGEPVDPEEAEKVEPTTLLLRKEALPNGADLPEWVCALTAGIDTQDDRLEALVWGWGPGEEGMVVDRWTITGDTSRPEPWEVLDELWSRTYRHEWGADLGILSACVDSAGHRTTMVYDYCHKWEHRQVYAIIGRDGPRPMTSSPTQRRWGRGERRCPLYTLGVDSAKALLYSRLRLTMKGPGYVHLPQRDWCDEEFAAQLTAEKLVRKRSRGHVEEQWVKIRSRNEALDCAVYGLCALRLRNVNLENLTAQLRELRDHGQPPPPRHGAGRRVIRSGYLGQGR